MQLVVNLCHGALVSTLALTIPAVLVIGLLTGSPVVLAESPVNLLLLGVTLAVAAVSAASPAGLAALPCARRRCTRCRYPGEYRQL